QPRVRLILAAALGFGLASGLMALMPTYTTYAIMTVPVGFASLTMLTAANATVQMSTSPIMRGRVMSLYMMITLGTRPLGAPIVGFVAEQLGPRWSVGVGAIAALLVTLIAAMWAVRSWDVVVTYRLRHRPRLTMYGPHERATQARQ